MAWISHALRIHSFLHARRLCRSRVNTYGNIFTVPDVVSNAEIMIFLLLRGYTRIISVDILLHHENICSRNFHMNSLISTETLFVQAETLPPSCPQALSIVSRSRAKKFFLFTYFNDVDLIYMQIIDNFRSLVSFDLRFGSAFMGLIA